MKKRTVRTIAGPRKMMKFARLARRRPGVAAPLDHQFICAVVAIMPGRLTSRGPARSAGPSRPSIAAYLTITSSSVADASSITKSAASSAVSRPVSTPWMAV